MGNVRIDFSSLKKYSEKLKAVDKEQVMQFKEDTVRNLAAYLLKKVVARTPVYKSIKRPVTFKTKKGEVKTKQVKVDVNDHTGGQLRQGWQIGEVRRTAGCFEVEVFNPVHYALYVEYGHRGVYVPELGKTVHKDTAFTPGKFMLTISEAELKQDASVIVERKLRKFLKGLETP